MNTLLFEFPIELRSIIFSTLSLRDISRLRQCCSAWKNNLQDLSFLKVLDFSYSPDISAEAFTFLLNKRINSAQNNIAKVILAHTRYLTKSSLEELFRVLPRIKDLRIRYSVTAECIPLILKQENLEIICYKTDAKSLSKAFDPWDVKCKKLTRFKVETADEIHWPLEIQMKLLEMNPALRSDINFLKFLTRYCGRPDGSPEYEAILEVIFSSDINIQKRFWGSYRGSTPFPADIRNYIKKTVKILSELTEDQLNDPSLLDLGDTLLTMVRNHTYDEVSLVDDEQLEFLEQLATKFSEASMHDRTAEVLDKSLMKFRKRPFHRKAREYYLSLKINKITDSKASNQQYEDELNKLIDIVASIMKRMPRRIRLMRAPLYLRHLKYYDAFKEYFGIIDPRYTLKIQADLFSDRNAQAIFGAYHVAKDYIKSNELLQQLQELNPENYKMITTHFDTIQNAFDKGVCTKTVKGQNFYKQYWYACYACKLSGDFKGICYGCAKSCHAEQPLHQTAYLRLTECYCDCNYC